ncbi:MAG: hypothetical protein ACE141_13815 [Bryobacteraceae bacterium]
MSRISHPTRRGFLRSTAAALVSVLPAAPAASIEPMKLGVFGLDYTFWGIWADLLSPQGRYLGTSALRMRPTHVWDKNVKKAQDFAGRWGCEVVERYDGMVGKVDAVLNGDLNNVPWQHLLLRPYLEAGIPCFLQRHWADTLAHLDEMLDLAAKHGTPIMATVPFEHYSEADTSAGRLKNIGEIQSVFGTADVTDEPHFHLPYLLMKILGYDVESVSMIADDVRKTGYLNINYVYPRTEKRRPFVASMHAARPDAFSFTVVGNQGTISAGMPAASSYFTRFFGQLVDIQKSFEKRVQYQPLDVIRKKYQCLQAAYYSKLERNSSPVKVGSVPADWPLPAWQPGWYDGSEFRR